MFIVDTRYILANYRNKLADMIVNTIKLIITLHTELHLIIQYNLCMQQC